MIAKLIYGVLAKECDKSTLDFIKFFDTTGLIDEKSIHKTKSFIEIYKYEEDSSNFYIAGITLMVAANDFTQLSDDAFQTGKIIFKKSIDEYKMFLNKTHKNDTFDLVGRLILLGENNGQ